MTKPKEKANGDDPSPNGIDDIQPECIDLTLDSDSDEEQEERLGNIRRRLAGVNNNDNDDILEIYSHAGKWTCAACTFTNWNISSTSCEMCGTTKTVASGSAVANSSDSSSNSSSSSSSSNNNGDNSSSSNTAVKKRKAGISQTKNVTVKKEGRSQQNKKIKKEESADQSQKNKKIKMEGSADNNPTEMDGVEVVAPQPREIVPVAASATRTTSKTDTNDDDDDDDDVVLTGVANELRLPHMRPHCTTCKFIVTKPGHNISSETIKINSVSCELCYCYVCDCPQKECKHWVSSTGSSSYSSNHCCGHDKDYRYVQLRNSIKSQKAATSSSTAESGDDEEDEQNGNGNGNNETPQAPHGRHFMSNCRVFAQYGRSARCCGACWCYVCDTGVWTCTNSKKHQPARHSIAKWRRKREIRKLTTYNQLGPWEPDHFSDSNEPEIDKSLIQCKHCKWWLRLKKSHQRRSASCDDWCPQCGRVATQKDFEKNQDCGKEPKKINCDSDIEESDDEEEGKSNEDKSNIPSPLFLFGTKSISFNIKAHNPRKIHPYSDNWQKYAQQEGWTFDEAAMREEVFLHRLGKKPKLSSLIATIPLVREGKIVESLTEDQRSHMNETDAVIISDRRAVSLLSMLNELPAMSGETKLSASWDAAKQIGTIQVELYLADRSFATYSGSTPVSHDYNRDVNKVLPCLVGLWFDGIFPASLKDFPGTLLKAESKPKCLDHKESIQSSWGGMRIAVHPFSIKISQKEEMLKQVFTKLTKGFRPLVKFHNTAVKTKRDELLLVGSDSSRFRGGQSPSPVHDDLDLKGNLCRFFGEQLDALVETPSSGLLVSFAHGLSSIHKDVAGSYLTTNDRILGGLLGLDKAIAANAMLNKDAAKSLAFKSRTFTNAQAVIPTLKHLESLGHSSEPFIEGFVDGFELLPFQQQSLKWAVEREQTPGGIQSFWWPKLPPSNGDRSVNLWFCPIINQFRKEAPRVVRGGIVAEEMGLGKTVISLGLILKNPAPTTPESGSNISVLDGPSSNSQQSLAASWDKNLYSATKDDNPKCGSILSRGTLVVCPVSLVGQWIEEAKSKLADPGLVYPYHGQSRKRNANTLAKNSIVVTTYNVLASDEFYHSKKAQNASSYCAPLKTIRWWRIIFDEGHCLRDSTTRISRAAASLVSDHKWIVTGTPFSTSVSDLNNILKVLGIEYVDRLLRAMIESSSRRSLGTFDIDQISYFLRPMMMRHSQNQKYANSQTTLMQLPQKRETQLLVHLSHDERKKYDEMEKEIQEWYMKYRRCHKNTISKHYLAISKRLEVLRDSCSGGNYSDVDPAPVSDDQVGNSAGKTDEVLSKFTFKSKLDVLISELEKTKNNDPTSKSLVFSQFKTTLDWLKEELPKKGFNFRTLTGDMSMKARAKALHDFQQDPPTTIFLLSMRSGAVGINLTQANRVYILEPHMNPAVEAQAIGRVHRLGQKREVQITRMIVANSVETRLFKFLEEKYGISMSSTSNAASKTDADEEDDDDDVDNSVDDTEEGKYGDVKDEKQKPAVKKEDKRKKSEQKKELEKTVVGNLRTEKAQANLEQWDLLFGVQEEVKKEEQERQQQQQQQQQEETLMSHGIDEPMVPDVVSSHGI